MEIKPEELLTSEKTPFERFKIGFKTDAAQEDSTKKLRKVLCEFLRPILRGDPALIEEELSREVKKTAGAKCSYPISDFEVRIEEFVAKSQANHKWAESVILTLVQKLKERSELPSTNNEYLSKGAV